MAASVSVERYKGGLCSQLIRSPPDGANLRVGGCKRSRRCHRLGAASPPGDDELSEPQIDSRTVRTRHSGPGATIYQRTAER